MKKKVTKHPPIDRRKKVTKHPPIDRRKKVTKHPTIDKKDPLGLMVVEHYQGDRLPQMTIAAQVVSGPNTSEERSVAFAIALKHPKDKSFNHRLGSKIARARLAKPFHAVELSRVIKALPPKPKDFKGSDAMFITTCMRAFLNSWINSLRHTSLRSDLINHYHVNKTPEHKAWLEDLAQKGDQ